MRSKIKWPEPEYDRVEGKIYLCPFTGLRKIWLNGMGYRVDTEIDASIAVKQCHGTLIAIPAQAGKLTAAGEKLKQL